MRLWQMWLIIFYVCLARVGSEGFVTGVGISAFLMALVYGWIRR
jgi:hypothetical protein